MTTPFTAPLNEYLVTHALDRHSPRLGESDNETARGRVFASTATAASMRHPVTSRPSRPPSRRRKKALAKWWGVLFILPLPRWHGSRVRRVITLSISRTRSPVHCQRKLLNLNLIDVHARSDLTPDTPGPRRPQPSGRRGGDGITIDPFGSVAATRQPITVGLVRVRRVVTPIPSTIVGIHPEEEVPVGV